MAKFKLTKDMFSCWGNGDEYDNELIIEHDTKIESKAIADQILQNQKLREIIEGILTLEITSTRDAEEHQLLQNLLEESKK